MIEFEEVDNLWKLFDEGHKHSNDTALIDSIIKLLSYYESVNNRDIEMYRQLLELVNSGGFLIKEEKQFLINYFIVLVSKRQTPVVAQRISEKLRDCTSILDVWPIKKDVRDDYGSGTYRKEAIIWFNRMYEDLGNLFLYKRNHVCFYCGMDLAVKLKEERCKLRDTEYPVLEYFFDSITLSLGAKETFPSDFERGLKVARKLIWKIKEGITKYS